PLGEKRNHPGSKLRQGFWMVFRFGVNNWGLKSFAPFLSSKYKNSPSDKIRGARNVVKSTAELLNFMVRDKIVH
ncbi:hypothetical protein, partial [Streptococcus pneumoniae]